MASKALVGFSFENLAGFGEVLHAKFVKELNAGGTSVTSAIEDTTENWEKIRQLITKIYPTLGLETYDKLGTTAATMLQIGDVVEIETRTYVITGTGNSIRTFPSYLHKDNKTFDPRKVGSSAVIKRPSLYLLISEKKQEYENLVTEVLQDAGLNEEVKKHAGTFKPSIVLSETSTHLQIGDLVFGVDPIQLSFTTQNGYQYYPTLRTNGNPKIPSLQQIKNISVSLIFPNVDAINYQLIPLFAMFKRTPFVNIKNRDLSRFYKEIASPEGYISVALESIQVQSIEGFPNSLQANITLLPFEPGVMGEGALKVLKSFDDVFVQQERMDVDAVLNKFLESSEDKMQDQSLLPSRFKDMVTAVSEATENFKESLPFRTFYQSLIAEHKYVREEDGSPARVYAGNDLVKDASQDLSFLAPLTRNNLLHHYSVEGNRKPLEFIYKYPTLIDKKDQERKGLRDIGKFISEERLDKNSERLNQLQELSKKFKQYMAREYKALPMVMFSAFGNLKEALRPYEYQFNKIDNIINQVLMLHNVEPKIINKETNKEVDVWQLVGFAWRGLLHQTGIAQITSTWQAINNLDEASYNKSASDMWSIIGGNGLNYIDANSKDVNAFGIHTVENAFKELWTWINQDPDRRTDLIINVFADIADGIEKNLLQATVVTTEGAASPDTVYAVRRLPIKTESFKIDNVHDVITAWSLVYNNKFVPINLLAYKYPFYQHLGSEDISLSLSIVSVPSEDKFDLKSELSVLSDRLYDSVKLVMFTSPDLITWMDPRIELKFATGSIFHAFGIEKVVLNSSNSTNIQGQPDSWNTVVNLTQANFSLEQYHSLSRTPSLGEVEAILSNLIPRLKLVGNEVKVMAYKSSNGVLPLDDLLFASFINSDAGDRYLTYAEALLSGTPKKNIYGKDLLATITTRLNEFSELQDPEKEDDGATGALRTMMLENRKFSELVKSIIKEYNNLLERQADAFINLIGKHTSDLQKLGKSLNALRTTSGRALVGGTALYLTCLLVPGIGWAAGTVLALTTAGIALGGVYAIAQGLAPISLEKAKDAAGSIISNMMSVYNKEMILSLSRAIIKDPPIRKKLLSRDIVSAIIPGTTLSKTDKSATNFEKEIEQAQSYKRINCYQDFDIPLTWVKDNRTYRASPDFYLYNPLDPQYYIASYIKDSVTRLLKVGKMGAQISLVEHSQLLNKFNTLLASLSDQGQDVQKLFEGISKELDYKDNLNNSLIETAKIYRQSALSDAPIKNNQELSDSQRNFAIGEADKASILSQFKIVNKDLEKKDPTLYKYELNTLETMLELNVFPKIQDTRLSKLNIIWTARMKTLLELVEMAAAIQTYFAKKTALGEDVSTNDKQVTGTDIFKAVFNIKKEDQLAGQSLSKIEKIRDVIWAILDNWQDAKTSKIANGEFKDKEGLKILQKAMGKGGDKTKDQVFDKGMYHANFNDNLSLPAIRILESEIYNKIGYYVRLNSAIDTYNATGQLSLDELPDLGFLDAYNVRTTEATIRQLEIEKQLTDSLKRQQNLSLRLFPTYKIYFIEEDKGTSSLLDDYYSYNAIQSIEISKSKDSASSVAVLRLSNLTGTITDKLSFHREKSDFVTRADPYTDDEAFFGTLDVKPGTKIQIKMGYAADERYLTTVFSGRIIEMNVGPVTELICQSYSAQLNHMIYQEKFGFFASQKELGDIASALLDMIPGLENLGKKDIITFGLVGGFSGRDLKKIRSNLFNNFLLSSILGRVTADLNATDNPRDENIYLPFNLSIYADWKPRFDWIVYNQSVWEAIQEICLYSTNTTAVIKQYNNDPISQRSEQRETIVVGNKSGYYKYTDALSLSSIDVDDIQNRIEELKGIVSTEPFKSAGGTGKLKISEAKGIEKFFTNTALKPTSLVKAGAQAVAGLTTVGRAANIAVYGKETISGPEYISGTLDSKWLPLWNFLNDPLNANIIKKRILSSIDLTIKDFYDATKQYAGKFKEFSPEVSDAIENLDAFVSGSAVLDPIKDNVVSTKKGKAFYKVANFMVEFPLYKDPATQKTRADVWSGMSPDEFYSVTTQIDNTNPALVNDPRYRKIQQHHLISDATNLITNSISLNSQFSNMVNVYFNDEPYFIDGLSNVDPKKFEDLNVWSVKAFGAIKDEQVRALNTYQKNIDPYWMDIKEAQSNFFKGYRRICSRDTKDSVENKGKDKKATNKALDGYIQNLNPAWGAFNINIPDWRAYPSYQVVGVNLLKREVGKMYRGAIQIVGDTNIEPLDIIHIEDYVNDLHGVVEVDEVIHTFTPDKGLITTITPCMLTYDRDPIQMEDAAIINRVFDVAQAHFNTSVGKALIGTALTAGGAFLASKQPIAGSIAGTVGILTGLSGFNGLIGQRYHKFLYENMGNMLGRDVINFTTLLYHGLPYMCGFDGVDYMTLKTLINHKVENVEGLISRITAFSDSFAAAIYTNFKPEDFGTMDAVVNKLGVLRYLKNLPQHGMLNDAWSFWDRLNPFNSLQ